MVILLLATVVLLPRPDASVKPALVLEPEQRARVAELQSTLLARPEAVEASLELANLFLDGRRPDWTLVTVTAAIAHHPNDYRLHHLKAIAYADRFEGQPAFEAAERAAALCEQRPAPAGAPACGEAAGARLALLTSTLAEVAKVDMKKQPYLAKEKIFKTLHPTFIPKPPKHGSRSKTTPVAPAAPVAPAP